MKNPIAGILARVSTGPQADGTSLETQVDRASAEAESHGYGVHPDSIWHEVWTGAEMDRPVLAEIRAAAARGLIQALVVYSTDRLSRDPLHLLNVVRELQEAGVALHFVEGPSDDTPEGQMLMYISGYVGFRERQLIAERTMRGKERIAQYGERLPNGTGSGLYGCDYDAAAKRRVLNPAEATVVRLIFQWASEGLSCYLIAVRLNDMNIPTKRGKRWHPLGVKRILSNHAYTGVQYYGQTRSRNGKGGKRITTYQPLSECSRIEGFTPAIITQGQFDAVQERLAVRQAAASRRKRTRYLLTGFTRCGRCGAPVVGASLQRKHRYYRCRATAPTSTAPALCDCRYIRADDLDALVWGKVVGTIKDPAVLIADLQHHLETGDGDLGVRMADLEREIADLKGQQRRLIELRQKDMVDQEVLETQLGPVKALCDDKQSTLRLLQEQQRQRDDVAEAAERISAYCERLAQTVDELDFDGQRALLAAFGVRVEATRDDVSITVVVDPNVTTIAHTLEWKSNHEYTFVIAKFRLNEKALRRRSKAQYWIRVA